MGGMRVVDSHLHMWNPWELRYEWLRGPLNHIFASEELFEEQLPDIEEEVAIFVQAGTVEADYVKEIAWVEENANAAGVVAIVAGAALDRGAETDDHLDRLARMQRVVGVRHLLQGEPDGFARTEAFLAGARGLPARRLTFDACVSAHQMPDVIALGEAVPDLRIVLDHLGKPAVGTDAAPLRPSAEWLRDLSELGSRPQTYVKLSGLPEEAKGHWSAEQLTPFLDAALEAFGPDRVMWGSDWPVSSIADGEYVAGSRARWFLFVNEWAGSRGVSAERLFWDAPLEFYGIR